MTGTKIFEDLSNLIATASCMELPGILTHLAALQTAIAARLVRDEQQAYDSTRKPLLTVDQIAEHLQLPKGRVYELIRQSKLPAVRIGKHLRMESGRLDQWITQHQDGPLDNPACTPRSWRARPGR
jgi:excisionase family DNA binding protein